MSDLQQTAALPAPPPPPAVVGRTPYDALSELFGLLGRALPWVTVLSLFLYTTIEIGKSYQGARSDAVKEFADRVTELNKLLQGNFSALETMRNSQIDGLNNFSKLNASVMETIAKNQTMLEGARADLAKARASQDDAAEALRQAKRDVDEAKRQQQTIEAQKRALEDQIAALERSSWTAENLIDSATRLTTFISEGTLGGPVPNDRRTLSLRFENAKPEAISRDSDGTLYYGQYRLPGGQIDDFVKNMRTLFPRFAARLGAAGGSKAAVAGEDNFKAEWQSLSRDRDFVAAQDAFIEDTIYNPFVERTKAHFQSDKGDGRLAFDPQTHSVALQAVLWSVAIQHGPLTLVVVRAFDGIDLASAKDEALIHAIYGERRKIDRYFPKISAATKTLLAARYIFEEQLALKMLSQ